MVMANRPVMMAEAHCIWQSESAFAGILGHLNAIS
jgi:hypothetical protein